MKMICTFAALTVLLFSILSYSEAAPICPGQQSYEWLITDLREGRQGHQSWALWLEGNAVEGEAFRLAVGTAADQWRHVTHYDQRIAAVNEIAQSCFASWYAH